MSGVYIHSPGSSPKKVNASDLPKVDFDFRASPMDTLLVEVYPRNKAGVSKKIEKGNDLRINFVLSTESYHIAPGDELSFEMPDVLQGLTQVMVQPDGYISLPYLNKKVKASGLTTKALGELTKKSYSVVYIDPKPSFSIVRAITEQIARLNTDYSVGSDGKINVQNLGSFYVLGRQSSDLEQQITTVATTYFGNNVKVSVHIAQNNNRTVLDTRLSPDGVQYFRNTVRVAMDGTIFIPDVGSVNAKDRSLTDIGEQIQTALQPLYQNPIDVNLSLQDTVNSGIYIGGEVRLPGRYNFTNGVTLLQIISQAGWSNDSGDLGNVILMHKSGENAYTVYSTNLLEVIDGSVTASQDLKLLPHDIIVVPPTSIGRANKWVAQYLRNMLPIGASVTYNFTRPVTQ